MNKFTDKELDIYCGVTAKDIKTLPAQFANVIRELAQALRQSSLDNRRLQTEHRKLRARIDLALEYNNALYAGDKDEAPETPGWYIEKFLLGDPFAFCPDCGEPVNPTRDITLWSDDGMSLVPPRIKCADCLEADDAK